MIISQKFFLILVAALILVFEVTDTVAQTRPSASYVPLIGITAVPQPLALPAGPGNVTYNYAVKNFVKEVPLGEIKVVDDKCNDVKFIEGDDNGNSKLDSDETWRYACTLRVASTTRSTATATGVSDNLTATHKAYSTVVVGSSNPAPLVSVVNVTQVAYPLSLPIGGGKISFIYRVSNPGLAPLSNVVVKDDKCSAMSGKLGDTNGNYLLDTHEVWVFTCSTTLKQTTTSTVYATAFANGLEAKGEATITVEVENAPSSPGFLRRLWLRLQKSQPKSEIDTKNLLAQASQSVLYVPLIGITSVPDPLALPGGTGDVTYRYAVKNFLNEVALNDVRVFDDTCNPIRFTGGDDDGDSLLDSSETWRYDCTTRISTTTTSVATAIGTANNITATHKAYATVVVGSQTPAPLVSIINITKVAFPLDLPVGGGEITFTYRVNNPGVVPLSNVVVTDDKCSAISGRLGDTNGNALLDITEVWVYTCSTVLTETTTNTVRVSAFANGLEAIGEATITVQVNTISPSFPSSLEQAEFTQPSFPETGDANTTRMFAWGILAVLLASLTAILVLTRGKENKNE